MKFINYLESISGVSIYPMISLGIFFLFFVALIIYVIRVKKSYIHEMENIPFDNKNETNSF